MKEECITLYIIAQERLGLAELLQGGKVKGECFPMATPMLKIKVICVTVI